MEASLTTNRAKGLLWRIVARNWSAGGHGWIARSQNPTPGEFSGVVVENATDGEVIALGPIGSDFELMAPRFAENNYHTDLGVNHINGFNNNFQRWGSNSYRRDPRPNWANNVGVNLTDGTGVGESRLGIFTSATDWTWIGSDPSGPYADYELQLGSIVCGCRSGSYVIWPASSGVGYECREATPTELDAKAAGGDLDVAEYLRQPCEAVKVLDDLGFSSVARTAFETYGVACGRRPATGRGLTTYVASYNEFDGSRISDDVRVLWLGMARKETGSTEFLTWLSDWLDRGEGRCLVLDGCVLDDDADTGDIMTTETGGRLVTGSHLTTLLAAIGSTITASDMWTEWDPDTDTYTSEANWTHTRGVVSPAAVAQWQLVGITGTHPLHESSTASFSQTVSPSVDARGHTPPARNFLLLSGGVTLKEMRNVIYRFPYWSDCLVSTLNTAIPAIVTEELPSGSHVIVSASPLKTDPYGSGWQGASSGSGWSQTWGVNLFGLCAPSWIRKFAELE